MKVLIVGSGAREHALAWRLRQSPGLTALWVASGNGGTAQIATNLNVSPGDVEAIPKYAKGLGIDLVVVDQSSLWPPDWSTGWTPPESLLSVPPKRRPRSNPVKGLPWSLCGRPECPVLSSILSKMRPWP